MKQREYETILILRPDVPEEEHARVLERVRGVITTKGGSLMRDQSWGKRKLAYEVKKQLKGVYHYLHYAAPADTVKQLEWTMKMIEQIIKFQSVKINDEIDVETRLDELRREEEEAAARRLEEENRPARRRDDDDDDDDDRPAKGREASKDDEDDEDKD